MTFLEHLKPKLSKDLLPLFTSKVLLMYLRKPHVICRRVSLQFITIGLSVIRLIKFYNLYLFSATHEEWGYADTNNDGLYKATMIINHFRRSYREKPEVLLILEAICNIIHELLIIKNEIARYQVLVLVFFCYAECDLFLVVEILSQHNFF